MKKSLFLLVAAMTLGLLAGCGDGRKEASQAEIQDANATRAAAIDNDPTLTPEQKEIQKSRLGGMGGGSTQAPR